MTLELSIMRYVTRELESEVQRAARTFPALILTGPRRSGKTSLLRHVFPDASYFLMEDPNIVSRLRSDPAGFLDAIRPPVILDEVQNAPEVFAHVRSRIDMRPRRAGQWLLTGSQEAPLMRGVTESMAGRAAIMQLRPLSIRESPKVALLSGGYPEPLARPRTASLWFSSFIQTYLERDVRGVSDVKDLATFRRFLSIVASRHGQILNKTDLAGPLGVSVPTVASWLNVLELTAQIILVPPFYENLGKRLTKSPKVYIADSGLACFLLGIESRAELAKSPFLGAIFEGFVAGEIIKTQTNAGRRPEIYHFRDAQGLEVDFLVPGRSGRLTLVECKAARSVRPSDSSSLARVAAAIRLHRTPRTPLNLFVVHQPAAVPARFEVLTPEVKAVSIERLVEEIGQGGRG